MGYFSENAFVEDNPFEDVEDGVEVSAPTPSNVVQMPPQAAPAPAPAQQPTSQPISSSGLVYMTAPDLPSALAMAGLPVPPPSVLPTNAGSAAPQQSVFVPDAPTDVPATPAVPSAPAPTAESSTAAPAAPATTSTAPAADTTAAQTEEEKKKAHGEAEAKRKAEWEKKQIAKKAAEAEKLARVAAMSDDTVMMEAMKQLGEDAEKLTRRNMKECVTEHIQTMCLNDPDFARKVMHPKKSFVHCIWHINNKVAEFAKAEMEANGFKPEPGGFPGSGVSGMYGCDVPDDMVYQWAEEYYNDPNAKEDEDKDDKFVPQPYRGTVTSSSKSKTKDKKKDAKKTEPKKPEPKPVPKQEDSGQLDFFAEAS